MLLSYATAAICIAFAASILYSIWRRVREGSFALYGTIVEKSINPCSFWAVAATAFVGACAFVYLGIREAGILGLSA